MKNDVTNFLAGLTFCQSFFTDETKISIIENIVYVFNLKSMSSQDLEIFHALNWEFGKYNGNDLSYCNLNNS
jgi:hypothetical protein